MAVNCPVVCGHCLGGNWRKYSQKIFVLVYCFVTIIALSLTIWATVVNFDESQIYFWFVAGVSVQFAIAVSLWNIFNHLVYYTKPNLQKYIVRMIGIIPSHSLNCWFSIRYKDSAIYLDTVRNFYQALVIYSFMSLLLSYLNDTFDDLEKILTSKPKFKSQPPCCCVKAVPNKRLIGRCRAGVLTYTIIHPLITIVTIITEITGHYTEGSFVGIWIWITIIDAISQVWAMYCLMIFYRATKEELQGLRPIGKLVAVQLTIFGSFFQSLFINIIIGLVQPTLNPEWNFENNEEFSRFIQDFVLCIEMSLSAVGHLYAFPYTIYKEPGVASNFCKSCISCCSVTDIVQDVAMHVKRLRGSKTDMGNRISYDEYDDEMSVQLDDVTIVTRAEPTAEPSDDTNSHHHRFTATDDASDSNQGEDNIAGVEATEDSTPVSQSEVYNHMGNNIGSVHLDDTSGHDGTEDGGSKRD